MNTKTVLATALAVCIIAGSARAQVAVFDPINYVQNLTQVAKMLDQLNKMNQQIQTARNQLQQAKQQYEAITGSRGMENIVTDVSRDYIPGTWQETLAGQNSQIMDLASDIKRTAGYLEDKDLAGLSSMAQDALRRSGDQAANAMASNAVIFQQSSERFDRLQVLMDSIPAATDDKAIQDLQARIQVEQVMLQNELIRANSLNAMLLQQQRVKEESIRQKLKVGPFNYPPNY